MSVSWVTQTWETGLYVRNVMKAVLGIHDRLYVRGACKASLIFPAC
jgi:hypothetical protein